MSILMLSILGKIFSRLHIELFFLFFQKTGFDISTGDHLHEVSRKKKKIPKCYLLKFLPKAQSVNNVCILCDTYLFKDNCVFKFVLITVIILNELQLEKTYLTWLPNEDIN